MTFSISALVLVRDSHIKPDSEAGGLIWVEGWYQGRYRKFHVMIFLSHILHCPFPTIDFYIAKKIFEMTNCENKSLRELTLFNLQILLFRVWFQKNIKRSVLWRLKVFVGESILANLIKLLIRREIIFNKHLKNETYIPYVFGIDIS